MTQLASLSNTSNEQGEFVLPKLQYAYDALEPYIDAQTVELHYSKHHQTYVTNLTNAIKSHPELAKVPVEQLLTDLNKIPDDIKNVVRNHGGGHANHCLYWDVMAPSGKNGNPSKDLTSAIEKSFGGVDSFKDQLAKSTIAVFGSGWGWLSLNKAGELIIETTPNQDSPISRGNEPIFGIDVWEHAYYLKYQNRRAEYVQNIFSVINWENVNLRYETALKSLKG
jgi:Fe-Mn family superoxide dismutase